MYIVFNKDTYTKWKQSDVRYGKEEKNMENWLGVLRSVLTYPQLYPGYLMPEEKQNLGTLKIGVSAGWILLFICIALLVLVCILLWRAAWFHKGKRTNY
jgi:hypothetical protein